jgi:hypothetical protein
MRVGNKTRLEMSHYQGNRKRSWGQRALHLAESEQAEILSKEDKTLLGVSGDFSA